MEHNPAGIDNPHPFTYKNYEHVLKELMENGYSFESFMKAEKLIEQKEPFVLMRHDVDFDLDKALKIAEVEAVLGVTSTFFFIIRTDHYNIFSSVGTRIISKILSLGHQLGLHFDCAAYPESDIGLIAQECRREVQMLDRWFGTNVSIVSYHRPNKLVLSGDPLLSYPLKHTYMPAFTKNVHYLSDSRGEWKFGYPTECEAFKLRRPLHILAHPIWWSERQVDPQKTLARFLEKSQYKLEDSIARNCSIYQRANSSLSTRSHEIVQSIK